MNFKKQVLMVEGSVDIQSYMFDLLSRFGYDVSLGGHGREALEMLKTPKLPAAILHACT